jgi:hypothetical protein
MWRSEIFCSYLACCTCDKNVTVWNILQLSSLLYLWQKQTSVSSVGTQRYEFTCTSKTVCDVTPQSHVTALMRPVALHVVPISLNIMPQINTVHSYTDRTKMARPVLTRAEVCRTKEMQFHLQQTRHLSLLQNIQTDVTQTTSRLTGTGGRSVELKWPGHKAEHSP